MDHEPISRATDDEIAAPIDVKAYAPSKPVGDMSKDEFDDWLESLPPCPGIPSTDEEAAASLARAEADLAAGRVHSHEVVSRWLATWGKPGRKPFREWLKSAG